MSSQVTRINDLEIQSQDIIKIILQYLKENSLFQSFNTLQDETGLSLNTVTQYQLLLDNVKSGKWDIVLSQLTGLQLTYRILHDIYEQIVIELLIDKEFDLVKYILRKTEVMTHLKLNHPERYLRLEHYLQKESVNLTEFFSHLISSDQQPYDMSLEKRRKILSDFLSSELLNIDNSRLLSLLTESLLWQQQKGNIPSNCQEFDLLLNKVPKKVVVQEPDRYPDTFYKTIKFNQKNKPESCKFSPDSKYLVTGSLDGFIEVWDYETGQLTRQLSYQEQDEFMMHDDTILCLSFSLDSEYLASGSLDKMIKVWHIKTGKCLRKFESAHGSGVTCLAFSKNSTSVLSGSFDTTLKLHGLKSGKTLKIFRGHQSFVNDCCFSGPQEERILSCSSDGKIRIWDSKSSDCLQILSSAQQVNIRDIAVRQIIPLIKYPDQLVVCNSSSIISILSIKTQNIMRNFTSDNDKSFLMCTLSPQQTYLYAISEDNFCYIFKLTDSTLVSKLKVHDNEVIGISQHPHKNILATYASDATLKIWKSSSNNNPSQ
ncbi:WD40 repeat-containing protein [Tieghemostelium lacteum]|uniref:WD40 repeat-containing protein n=1 Tax=Tieghemostelium lacteum TaxID=361077 RepID=A0A151ZDQ6_TIELA|nr:WD40 repeat-containing protein [Tieghemostelium lacteum]|eukprot:KYQ92071.1 WD40 repeat-containing protein [Tieghemostelium lacteum]